MTKFEGDAIGARAKAKGYTAKERSRDMETFLATGVHPDIQRAQGASTGPLPQLPQPRTSRAHVFLQIVINRRQIGRIVIELFSDVVAAPAGHFLGRCTGGSGGESFAGTRIHKVLPGLAVFGGKSNKYVETVQMKRDASLRHVERGVVSMSNDGTEFCITLAKALHLDETHQVIGRVLLGMDVVERISAVPTTAADETPTQAVVVQRCGSTDAAGSTEFDVSDSQGGAKTAEEDLKKDAEETRQAMHAALEAGMKRKAGAVGGSRTGTGPSGAGAVKKKVTKRSALDAVLLGGGSSSDDSDSE